MKLAKLTISQVKKGLKEKEFSCQELLSYYFKQIEDQSDLNSFITLNKNQALKEAAEVDRKIENGDELLELAGVPMAVKDIILTEGLKTTGSSKILADYVASYDATVIKRLKEQGAIVLGKTGCDEFAMGSSNENSAFGPVKNPYDLARVPGGSSGGSAVAVAADQCVFSLGTDTGGSIRQPAAFTGVCGLKPSYGRVSRYGLMAMASSLDQPGPFTRTVEDAAVILKAIAGADDYDATSSAKKVDDYFDYLSKDLKGFKIGLDPAYLNQPGLAREVKEAVERSVVKFKDLGAEIKEVKLPKAELALAAYYILMPAEVSSNLARYDGIRYGLSANTAKDLEEVYQKTRAEGFGAEVKRRIIIGTYVLSAGYQDQYYQQARKVRQFLKDEYNKVFQKVDALITPTTPTTAFKLGEKINDPLSMYLADIYTVTANIVGLCGLSLPIGFDSQGLPIGLQLLGAPFAEGKILQAGYNYQQSISF
ncbi:MAG: Asp-tRNA(Asn)/Glu-tRNA(Gln) amidotransferase GatCAB subunit A [Candidatus Komeilibacteria bacterium CG10_big_fil_rev_8_21_14_0_10_41_13]|uniref:Glutamyl-tRNA(Gln) amidotransferase subunit A n=1 Tax=Candidatus Komeilibacteria bacterium CG10_big_fil_rev_8_21_14_0_10_41_13 TaxID=1974476 RepID=A0A2M6WBU1_9BACT|nr:MAG: Asp-tRNA(Asn)/Glu-tRNA(Gln) amidotransferase GatCAB subunit A [Candidatus Komeilibacteria bacterium CG10_big_fil_rev_8_21_14_0_10_41_13]